MHQPQSTLTPRLLTLVTAHLSSHDVPVLSVTCSFSCSRFSVRLVSLPRPRWCSHFSVCLSVPCSKASIYMALHTVVDSVNVHGIWELTVLAVRVYATLNTTLPAHNTRVTLLQKEKPMLGKLKIITDKSQQTTPKLAELSLALSLLLSASLSIFLSLSFSKHCKGSSCCSLPGLSLYLEYETHRVCVHL